MRQIRSKSLFPQANEQFLRFNELLAYYPALSEMAQIGEKLQQGFQAMLADIWLAFYCPEKVGIVEEISFHAQFLTELLQTEQYTNWCQFTAYDDLLALITTLSISEDVLQELKKQERFEQIAQNLGMKDAQKKRYQQTSVRNIDINQIVERSKQETKKMKESLTILHSLEGKEIHEIPLRDQLTLATGLQNNDTVKKIAELTGKFKRIALKKFKTKQKITMQRKDVTLGQELSRLLPVEIASFVMPQSKLAFYRKFVEHETMIFDQIGTDQSGRGPIIICMDESSSMSFLKEESKAFCLALVFIAKKQKRDFAIIPFATSVGDVTIFEKGQASTEAITNFATSFLGGGTNYEKALTEALNILKRSKFKQADVLFVTDGTSFLPSSFIAMFNATKKKLAFTCTSVVLTNLYNAVDISLVKQFSDQVIEASDLFSADKAFNVILS